MRGTAVEIDVGAVGCVVQRSDARARALEEFVRDVRRRAVGAVEHEVQAREIARNQIAQVLGVFVFGLEVDCDLIKTVA